MQTNPSAHQTSSPSQSSAVKRSGHPSLYCAELVAFLCSLIAEYGMSDSAAAATAKVPPSTLSRWKDEHPGFEQELTAARETFRIAQIELIREAHTRDGRRDWRAAAWLLVHVFPEDYGRRSTRQPTALPPSPDHRDLPAPAASTFGASAEHSSPARSEISETSQLPPLSTSVKAPPVEWPRSTGNPPASGFQNFRNPPSTKPAPLTGPIAPQKSPCFKDLLRNH